MIPLGAVVWHVYLLRCGDGSLYTGIARDAAARFAQHCAGRGARYTRGRGPLALVYVEPAASHGDALRREAAIRRLGRAGKEMLIRCEGRDVRDVRDVQLERSPEKDERSRPEAAT